MVDFSLPVSKRTRQRRELAELRRKRQRKDSAVDDVRGPVSTGRGNAANTLSVNRGMEAGRYVLDVESEDESDSDSFGDCSESLEMEDLEGFSVKGDVEVIDLEDEDEDEDEGFDYVNSGFSISKSAAAAVKNEDFVCVDLDDEDGGTGLVSSCKGKGVLEKSPHRSIGESHCLNSNGFESGGCSYNTEPAECCSDDDVVDECDESGASSSEEDDDDPSDENYELEEAEESLCSESSSTSESSSSEDEQNYGRHYVEDESRWSRRKERKIIDGGLKRKKACGWEDLGMDVHNFNYKYGNVEIGKQVNCVARRTRSRYLPKVENIYSDHGTFRRPVCLDEEGTYFQNDEKELDSSFRHDCSGSRDNDCDSTTDDEIYKPRPWSSSSKKRTQFNNQSDDILSEEEEDVDILSEEEKEEDVYILSEEEKEEDVDILSEEEKEEDVYILSEEEKDVDILPGKKDVDIFSRKEDDILLEKKDDGFLSKKKGHDTNKVESSRGRSKPIPRSSSSKKRIQFNNESDDILPKEKYDDILSGKKDVDILPGKKDVDIFSRKEDDILLEKENDGFLSKRKDHDTNKVESSHGRSKPIPRSSSSRKRIQFNNESDDILPKEKYDDILSGNKVVDVLSRKKDDDIFLDKKDDGFLTEEKNDDTSKVEASHGRSKPLPSSSSSKKRTQFNKKSNGILSRKEDVDILPEKKCEDILSEKKDVDAVSKKKDDDTIKVESSHGRSELWDSFLETCNSSEDCENIPKVHPKICHESDDIIKTNGCTSKVLDVSDILMDSIIADKELPSDEFDLPIRPVSQTPLPLKFSFEDPRPPKKSEEDEELDHLWAELDFSLRSADIGVLDHNSVQNENVYPSKLEQVDRCLRGDHQLLLHEEIGLRCTCCSYVQLEMKYVVPSFDTNPSRKSQRKESGSSERVKFDDLQEKFDCDSHDRSDTQSHFGRTVWDIIPGIKDDMYPHQREGFEFIWKNVAGGIDLDEIREGNGVNNGSGCIVSHAPGTGKTRLTIVFLQTYMELNPTCRPMIIAPSNMLLTWEEEFLKWKVDIPFHNLNKRDLTFKEDFRALKFLMESPPSDQSVDNVRLVKILSWQKQKSILGISYKLFEILAGVKQNSNCHKVRNVLLELPGLVVFDEGHIPRNDVSLIWMALSKIKTEKRIILSGTPFQNNFTEFSNTLRLARPSFADVINAGDNKCLDKEHARPKNIPKGKWDLLISSIDQTREYLPESPELREIRAMINPFVHVYRGSILREKLPGLRRSIVILRPAELQKNYLESIVWKNSLESEYVESLISVHPSLKLKCDKKLLHADKVMLESVRLNPELGVKIQFLLEIIRLSEALNEKVLVFSQYIEPLSFIEDHLKYHFSWNEGTDIFHMDGKRDLKKRQVLINTFNDPKSEVKVLLASTRACSEGINLIGASRVVLLDVVWNPSVERQAICRAYRLGQKKVVYIYHLITSGTREEEKYSRQMKKDRLSELVFSSEQSSNENVLSSDLDDRILEAVLQHEKLKHIFQKIAYQSKESSMCGNFGLVDPE